MAIDASVGGVSSNSYATLAEFDAYFLNHPSFDIWDAYVDQEAVAVHATRLLDQLNYVGDKATTTQALEWPRIDNDLYDISWANNVIPPKLKMAEFETALWLINTGGVAVAAGTLTSLKVGTEVVAGYSAGSSAQADTSVDSSGIPITASRFLKGLRLLTVLA
jgi:hypothetical protein